MNLIAHATDGSDEARAALDLAIELCKETGASLAVISVKPPLPSGKGISLPVNEVEEPHGAEHIAGAAADVARAAGLKVDTYAPHGDPATEIALVADKLGADLLVVGSRGFGAVHGALVGSVSRALMKRSKVPVTVVTERARTHA
jgi:nucleotide-binding universal stress UspA family protein